jgi:hypothetical protein
MTDANWNILNGIETTSKAAKVIPDIPVDVTKNQNWTAHNTIEVAKKAKQKIYDGGK